MAHSHIYADVASEEEVRMFVGTWNSNVLIVCGNNGRVLYVYSLKSSYKARKS